MEIAAEVPDAKERCRSAPVLDEAELVRAYRSAPERAEAQLLLPQGDEYFGDDKAPRSNKKPFLIRRHGVVPTGRGRFRPAARERVGLGRGGVGSAGGDRAMGDASPPAGPTPQGGLILLVSY